MTHNDDPSRLDALREELVAYLDGELSPGETARIEEKIACNPQLRRELDYLAKTWDWLDALERPTVDEEFTRTTMEMVAASAMNDAGRIRREAPRRAALEWVFGCLAASLLTVTGFLAASALWTNPNQWLLENYSLIQNQDLYRRGESLAYLELLDESGVFDSADAFEADAPGASPPPAPEPGTNAPQPPPSAALAGPAGRAAGSGHPAAHAAQGVQAADTASGKVGTDTVSGLNGAAAADARAAANGSDSSDGKHEPFRIVPPKDAAAARKEIAALSAEDRLELQQRLARFSRLTPAEQDRLRRFHEELWRHPKAEHLARVLVLYCRWYAMLMPHQRLELETLPEQRRIAWIRERQQELLSEAMRNALFNFPPDRLRDILSSTRSLGPGEQLPREDWGALFKFFENLAAGRARQMLDGNAWPPARREEILRNLNRFQDDDRKREYLAMLWLQNQLDHPDSDSPITAEDVAALRAELSSKTRQRLEALSPEAQTRLVWTWARAGVIFRYIAPRVMWDFRRPMSEQELSKFVEEQLSKEDRERLLALPPEEMRREVIRLYLRQNFPGMGEWGRGRGRGGQPRGASGPPPDAGPPFPLPSP